MDGNENKFASSGRGTGISGRAFLRSTATALAANLVLGAIGVAIFISFVVVFVFSSIAVVVVVVSLSLCYCSVDGVRAEKSSKIEMSAVLVVVVAVWTKRAKFTHLKWNEDFRDEKEGGVDG